MIDQRVGEIRELLKASEASRWKAGRRIAALKEDRCWTERAKTWEEFCPVVLGCSDEWANSLAGVATDFDEEDARTHTVSKLAAVRKAPREWWPELMEVEGGKREVAERARELRREAAPPAPPRETPPPPDPSWQPSLQIAPVPIPTFDRGPVVLHQGDVQQVLRMYEEDWFDACLCDPPYGFTAFRGKGQPEEWEKKAAPPAALWQQVFRVLKPGAVLLAATGARTYHTIATAIEEAGFEIRSSFQWLYSGANATGVMEGQRLRPAHEPYVVAVKPYPDARPGRDRYPGIFNGAQVATCHGTGGRFFLHGKVTPTERGPHNDHPTLKPLALTTHLASLLRRPADGCLLVPFAGSGSEILGALDAGWPHVTGIELEAKYVETAQRRIVAHDAQRLYSAAE